MKFSNILAAGSIIVASTIGASAATLTGDDVTLSISEFGFSQTATVGAGSEFFAGNVSWDVDFGADGDELLVSVLNNFGTFGITSFEISSLDFSGGELLTGFSNLFSQLANITVSTTSSSILFSFDNGPVTSGTVLSGKFDTSSTAPVPLPAGAWMLLTALGGLAVTKRRRTRSA